jgi:hypothetical protein
VQAALRLYQWLQQRRAATEDLYQLGGVFQLETILQTGSALPPTGDPVPVLPVRLWQEGALLFAASAPSEPDHHLRLLEQAAGTSWQWLPLVGPDFPLQSYAQRGPLVAWTPHLAGVAIKLDRKTTELAGTVPVRRSRYRSILAVGLVILLLGLLAGNLWSTVILHQRLTSVTVPVHASSSALPERTAPAPPASTPDDSRDRFAVALADLLAERAGRSEWAGREGEMVMRYEQLVRGHKDLQLAESNTRGKVAVAAVSVLAERSADRVEGLVRRALANKGFSDKLIQAACEHVREQILTEGKDSP